MTWSGLSSVRLTSRCPDWHLTGPVNPWDTSVATLGPLGPLRVWSGQSEVSWGISKPFWYCEEHFRSVWIWTCLFQKPIMFCTYLSPLISHRKGAVFKIYISILVFRRKKWFRNPSLGSWDNKQIQKVNFFWDALYITQNTSLEVLYSYCFP